MLSHFAPCNPEAPLVDLRRRMPLALAMDRFQLKFHTGSKEDPVDGGNGAVQAGNATLDFIASNLSRSLGRPVLDRTGLTGAFDFTLENVYDHKQDLATIAERVVSDLGLKLESSRGQVEAVFIDHVERPSAN